MKKTKKLTLEKTTIRRLTDDQLHGMAGGLSTVRLTQSSCNSAGCSGEVLGCAGTDFVICG